MTILPMFNTCKIRHFTKCLGNMQMSFKNLGSGTYFQKLAKQYQNFLVKVFAQICLPTSGKPLRNSDKIPLFILYY